MSDKITTASVWATIRIDGEDFIDCPMGSMAEARETFATALIQPDLYAAGRPTTFTLDITRLVRGTATTYRAAFVQQSAPRG